MTHIPQIQVSESKLFYTLSELAALTGSTPETLRRYAASGEIPAKRQGRKTWIVLAEDLPEVAKIFPALQLPQPPAQPEQSAA